MAPRLSRTAANVALLAGRFAVVVLVLVLVVAAWAAAQEPPPIPGTAKSIPADHVPSWVLYWAIIIAGILGAGLVGAIKYLWSRLTDVRKEEAGTLKAATDALAAEQTAHRNTIERLKQESADFGREAVKQLAVSTEAIEDLTAVTNQLLAELNRLKGK